MKKITIIALLILLACSLFSQTPAEKRSTLGIAGQSRMVTLNQIQCLVHESIGQKSVIGTGCSGNYRLSQGFIQPLYGRSTRKSTNQLKASIFPNPFTDVVTITFDEDIAENIQVTLLDMLGNTLQVNVYPKSQEIHLTPNSLNQGIYLLRIQSGGKLLTAKIIKE